MPLIDPLDQETNMEYLKSFTTRRIQKKKKGYGGLSNTLYRIPGFTEFNQITVALPPVRHSGYAGN